MEELLIKSATRRRHASPLSVPQAPMLAAMPVAEPPSRADADDADESTAALSALSALSLSPPDSGALPVLAWDALNYLLDFLDERLMREDPWRAVRALEARVAEFAAAARLGGYRLVTVVDADTRSAEAGAKWRGRRVRELTKEQRNIVLGADVLLTDSLREHGVSVVRPLNADADDVLAALAASTPGGGVLSRDGDMFRYTNPPLDVFDGWRLVATGGGEAALVPTRAAPSRASAADARSARDVQPALAAAALVELADEARASSAIRDKYAASAKGGAFKRGCSSSSDRRRGSLHVLARPLRAAVYARLGEPTVRETLPLWRDGGVAWVEDAVAADASLDAVVDDVLAAAAWLDEHDGDDATDGANDVTAPPWSAKEVAWRAAERRFNRRILAAELCAAAAAPGADAAEPRAGSLLALMRSFGEYSAPSAAPNAAQRRLARSATFEGGRDLGQAPALSVTCVECRTQFYISAGEVNFFQTRGFALPRRCKPCRERRKAPRS